MPRRFYRFSYIIDATWTRRKKKQHVTIHSLFFCFKEDFELEEVTRDEAWKIHDKIVEEWAIVDTSEEFEEVTSGESKGIGYYYLHVLVNDELVKKVHLRHRQRGKSFFDVVSGAVQTFAKYLRGR